MRIDRIRLCVAVERRGVTYTKLSEISGVSRQTISAVKQGKRCNRETAKKIADALDVELSEIMEVR